MKKISCLLVAFTLLVVNVMAGPFGDLAKTLNSFDTNPAEAAVGSFPEGKDVFPIIWKYVYDEPVLADKVLDFSAKFNKYNVIANTYTFTQQVIFKFGITLQMQESVITVTQEGNTIKVQTSSMINYGVDKNWKKTTDGTENQRKVLEQNSKNILQTFTETVTQLSDVEYKSWEEKAYSNIWVQQSVALHAGNKLKAKKWYNAHPIEGKQININCFFADINESKNDKYEYVIGAVVGTEKPIIINFYSNNDSYIDLIENQSMTIAGTITKVIYSSEYSSDYCIDSLIVEE